MQQRDVAKDAAHPPHILIFQIAAVTPAQHHYREAVFTLKQKMREIEFRRQTAVLTVSDPATVAPQMEGGIHAIKNDPRLACL